VDLIRFRDKKVKNVASHQNLDEFLSIKAFCEDGVDSINFAAKSSFHKNNIYKTCFFKACSCRGRKFFSKMGRALKNVLQ